jgi:hypothetical protein
VNIKGESFILSPSAPWASPHFDSRTWKTEPRTR